MIKRTFAVSRKISKKTFLFSGLQWIIRLAAALLVSLAVSGAQTPASSPRPPQENGQSNAPARKSYPIAQVQNGDSLFQQNCSFCHGRDAGGGEGGPDLK